VVVGLTRLARSPYNPTEDRIYWECALASARDGLLEGFHAWVTGPDAIRLVRPEAASDRWVEEQIEKLAAEHDHDLSRLAALAPVQLRPDPS